MSRRGTSWFPGSALPGASWKGNNGAEGTAVAAAAAAAAAPDPVGLPRLAAVAAVGPFGEQDMHSSEKPWTAESGLVLGRDSAPRLLQS